MDFDEVIGRRRMVRRFRDEAVPHDVLVRIVRAARRAPSAGNAQGQRLVVVTDRDTRRVVAEACGEHLYVADGFAPWISTCAAQVVPCVSEQVYHDRYREPDKLDAEGREIDWPVPYWWTDIGATALLVHLAAIAEGLAAGFAGPVLGVAPLAQALGIPDGWVPIGVIPIGHPLDDRRSGSLARGRVALEDYASWERWGGPATG